MEKLKVLVADAVSQRGVDEINATPQLEAVVKLKQSEEQLIEIIPEYSALVVRSETKVTAKVLQAAKNLKVVGRAGVGVDNVDVEAATRQGVIVMNTPAGNTISTAEHAFSLLMSTARMIPQAHGSMRAGKWDRKTYQGVELYNKTLAILGMGRIGTEVARRAIAFGMRVLAYDPYLSSSKARTLQVELLENLDDAVTQADFITMHMPLTPETQHMISAERIAKMKRGVRIVNCARGGLIDENALADALKSGQVAGAALDVYEQEPPPAEYPLRDLPNLVMTPHLGASTVEAQESVGIEIAQAIKAALVDGEIRNAVNLPSIDSKTLAVLGPWIDLAERLGKIVFQLAPKRADSLMVNISGKLAESDTKPMTRSTLKGFLRTAGGGEVNEVNAPMLAETLGIDVKDTRSMAATEYTELIEVVACAGSEKVSVAGTFFAQKPRIVMINGKHVEAKPDGVLLVLENRDRPGIIGHVGSIIGSAKVNIATMSLARTEAGGRALTVLNLDSEPPEELLKSLLADPDIFSARVIKL